MYVALGALHDLRGIKNSQVLCAPAVATLQQR